MALWLQHSWYFQCIWTQCIVIQEVLQNQYVPPWPLTVAAMVHYQKVTAGMWTTGLEDPCIYISTSLTGLFLFIYKISNGYSCLENFEIWFLWKLYDFRSKNITIETKDPDDRFKGFMLQIHYDADRYDRNFPFGPIGKFTVSPNSPYKCMDCNSKCDR